MAPLTTPPLTARRRPQCRRVRRATMSPAWILLSLLPALGERFSCRGRILGGYYADVKSGCRAFHVCVRVAGAGVRDFRFYCPPGTLFQQQAQTCTDWGDDDGLACPTDLDDGQFDLYKIGSGFDTKKVSSSPQREEEPEFSLQRAETGDRRLHQDSPPPQPQPQSDLRAAHSSDFFSGRRDRGRDEPAPTTPPPAPPSTRAPYRRPPPRATPRPTTFPPQPTPQQSFPESPVPYDPQPKRKLVRKRPVHSSTAAPSEFTTASKQYFRSTKPDYDKVTAPQQTEVPRSSYNEDSGFVDVVKVSLKAIGRYDAPSDKQRYNDKSGLTEVYNYNAQSTPNYNNNFNKNNNLNTNYNQQRNANFQSQNVHQNNQQSQNFDNQNSNYNNQNRNFNNEKTNLHNDFNNQNNNLKNNENFNAQNEFKSVRPENRQFKATVRNNFNVAPPADFTSDNEVRKNVEVSPNGVQRSTNNYQEKSSRNIGSSTPAYSHINSVSYDADTKLDSKQSFANSQTIPDYEKRRITAPLNLNTVAYKTNVGFDARPVNYGESEEDDGQYRLPSGEDDGQYRPELYERDRELLSGAHSLNIAASGNRLPEDQKLRRPSQQSSQAAPRPFSAVATSTQPPRTTENYPTTAKPQPRQQQPQTSTANYHQSYSSTGRQETQPPAQTTFEYSNSVFTTRRPTTPAYVPTTTQFSPAPSSFAPQALSNKPAQEPVKSAPVQKKQHQPQPSFAKPVKSNKEDASYDYAYYDSDTGFSEYEQIEEFGKTKTKL